MHIDATYILPIRRQQADPYELRALATYLRSLDIVDVIVVDGSPANIFSEHHAELAPIARHVAVDDPQLWGNGKAAGVLTGLRLARHERVVIADDDVRYDRPTLARVVAMLDDAGVVRPQNYFDPLPWHARYDTSRTLLNRAFDGDWPGTLAVRRSLLQRSGGYDANVLFENLELVRTVRAAGGRECVALDAYVRRVPPSAAHFLGQRVRQAYDEFARPLRLLAALAIAPLVIAGLVCGQRRTVGLAAAASVALAERGRRRAGGARVFPATSSLLAPLWIAERAACSWIALALRLRYGGVRYGDRLLTRAATPRRILANRIDALDRPSALAAR